MYADEESTGTAAARSSISASPDKNYFDPFPAGSTTVIVAPPFSGKSFYIKRLIENQHLYFREVVRRVFVVNCRQQISFYELEEQRDSPRPLPEVVQCVIDDYDPDLLEPNDLLVIEDLQVVDDRIRQLLTAVVHHGGLSHCFVVVHGILGTKKYELLNYAHCLALFLQSTSVTTLANYILSTRFVDAELKRYLKLVLGVAERQKAILHIEINNLPSQFQPLHVAFSHLLQLADRRLPFAICYAYPSTSEMYAAESDRQPEILALAGDPKYALEKLPRATELIPGSFLVLSPDCVEKLRSKSAAGSGSGKGGSGNEEGCLAQSKWEEVVNSIERDVESFVPSKRWSSCKGILFELLQNDEICILKDRRRMRLRTDPTRSVVSILDYLMVASRRNGPSELASKGNSKEYKLYREFTLSLLDKFTPSSLFKNKLVLPNAATVRNRRMLAATASDEEEDSSPSATSGGSGSPLKRRRRIGGGAAATAVAPGCQHRSAARRSRKKRRKRRRRRDKRSSGLETFWTGGGGGNENGADEDSEDLSPKLISQFQNLSAVY